MKNIESVSYYAPYPSEEVLGYPFERPTGSFITDGETVQAVSDNFIEFQEQTDAYLAAHGLPLLSDRLPVIAYGANSNPARLHKKMDAFGDSQTEAERQTVPNIVAVIPDNAIAWHGKPGQGGATFAELYKDSSTDGVEAVCHVSFLTEKQLAVMHVTEGVTYHLTPVDVRVGTDDAPLEAFAYTAGFSHVLLKDGAPVSVRRSGEDDGRADSMTAEQAVDYMLANSDEAVASTTARELVEEMKRLPLNEKKIRQERVRSALADKGISQAFSYPDAPYYVGRAAFDFHGGTNIRLMEQVVDAMRPGDVIQRGNVKTDIAHALRQRAHDELADHILNHTPKD